MALSHLSDPSPDLEPEAAAHVPGVQQPAEETRLLREQLIAAAEGESQTIISRAAADMRDIVVKARHDLEVLAAQVRPLVEQDAGDVASDTPPRRREAYPGEAQASFRILHEASRALDSLWSPAHKPSVKPAAFLRDRGADLAPPATRPLRFGRAALAAAFAVTAVLVAMAVTLNPRSRSAASQNVDAPATRPLGAASTARDVAAEATPNTTPAEKPLDRPAPGADRVRVLTTAPTEQQPSASASPTPTRGDTHPVLPPGAEEAALAALADRWLDAYYSRDAGRMAAFETHQVSVSDERAEHEQVSAPRPPHRTVSARAVQVFGSGAVVTATVTERAGTTAEGESVSYVSQVWTHQAGEWRLTQVRIVSADAVKKAFRR